MINKEMARDYLIRATRCLREAETALSEGDPPAVIRRSQEALELAVKALLRSLAIEYPRTHDVSDALLACVDRLPNEIARSVKDLANLVAELASIRGPAFYGYEREGIPASQAFKPEFAQEIYEKVARYLKTINKTLTEKLNL
jgi:HEPN domain-containing protein